MSRLRQEILRNEGRILSSDGRNRFHLLQVSYGTVSQALILTTMTRVRQASARTMATSSESSSTTNGTIRSTLSSSSRKGHSFRKSCKL